MSFAILQVFAEHLSLRGSIDSPLQIARTMKMLRADGPKFHLEELDVHEQKRTYDRSQAVSWTSPSAP
jgi:hypothetical protein